MRKIGLISVLLGMLVFSVLVSAEPSLVSYNIDNMRFSPNGDGLLDNATIDIEFNESVNYTIAVMVGDQIIWDESGTAKNDSKTWNGTYESNATVVPDGEYLVNISWSNPNGEGFDDTQSLFVDTVAPSLTITSPSTSVGHATAELKVVSNESIQEWVYYKLDSVIYDFNATSSTSANATLTDLTEGEHTLTVYALDLAGNSGNQTLNFTVDLPEGIDAPSTVALSTNVKKDSQTINKTFEIKNTGERDLSDITFTIENLTLDWFSGYEDFQIDKTWITFSSVSSLPANSSANVTVTIELPGYETERDMDEYFGIYKGTITVKDGNDLASDTFSLEVELRPEYDDGELEITDVKASPDSLYPGEKTEVTVDVKNGLSTKDMESIDVRIEIPDLDISEEESISKLTHKKTKELTFEIEVPLDAAEDDYTIYVYAEGEDEDNDDHAGYDISETLSVKRDSHDLYITKVKLSEDEVNCGDTITATVTLANIGTSSEDNIILTLKNSDLDVNLRKTLTSLDSDEDISFTFEVEVPEGVDDGDYILTAEVSYDDVSSQGKDAHLTNTATLTVNCAGEVTVAQPADIISGTATAQTRPGKPAKFLLTIFNKESAAATYTFKVSGISDWATVKFEPGEEITLGANQSIPVYVYLYANEDAEAGEHTATFSVYSGSTLVDSATLTTTVSTTGVSAISWGRGVTGAAVLSTEVAVGIAATIIVIIAIIAIAGFALKGSLFGGRKKS